MIALLINITAAKMDVIASTKKKNLNNTTHMQPCSSYLFAF